MCNFLGMLHFLEFSSPPPLSALIHSSSVSAPPPPPPAIRTRSHKGNREPFYTHLLLVLAAIYGSAGSSDVGCGAAGGSGAVSASRNLHVLPTFSPSSLFFFQALLNRVWEQNSPTAPRGPRR